jgi:hypothetical protein
VAAEAAFAVERGELLAMLRCSTPRPSLTLLRAGGGGGGEEGGEGATEGGGGGDEEASPFSEAWIERAVSAASAGPCRGWPAAEVVALLLGDGGGASSSPPTSSSSSSNPPEESTFGCLAAALDTGVLDFAAVASAVRSGDARRLLQALEESEAGAAEGEEDKEGGGGGGGGEEEAAAGGREPRDRLAAALSARVGAFSAGAPPACSPSPSPPPSSSDSSYPFAEALASWLCGRTRSGRRLDEAAVAAAAAPSSPPPPSPSEPSPPSPLPSRPSPLPPPPPPPPPPPLLPRSLFGALAKASVDAAALEQRLSLAPASTAARVASLESLVSSLRRELRAAKDGGGGGGAVAAPSASAKPPRSSPPAAAAAAASAPSAPPPPQSPLEAFLAALDAAGESEPWREGFPGLGTSAEVPRLLRSAGRVRNKGIAKRETERTVKEIWKERLAAAGARSNGAAALAAGGATPLIDFVFSHLQKRVGIAAVAVEVRTAVFFSNF